MLLEFLGSVSVWTTLSTDQHKENKTQSNEAASPHSVLEVTLCGIKQGQMSIFLINPYNIATP